MHFARTLGITLFSICLLLGLSWNQQAIGAENKIGTVDLQKVLSESESGQAGQKKLEQKVEEFRAKFADRRGKIEALQESIDKKKSVWSEETLKEKQQELSKMEREFQVKQEDAKYELEQIQEDVMQPILKDLQDIIEEYGKEHGYTLILDNTEKGLSSRSGLLYASESIDISDEILDILNEGK
ncbi:MAG: OmpH family outer membrane protein [Desulfurivibrionaceae bacterium]